MYKIYNVYILTEDVPWVGYTGDIRNRMYVHKHFGNITNAKSYKVLYTTTDKDKAKEVERQYHDKGYLGRHNGGQTHIESGHMNKMRELAGIARRTPIKQYTKDGNFIKEFMSQREAAKELNLNYKNINSVLKGKRKSAGGFVFKYKEELAC